MMVRHGWVFALLFILSLGCGGSASKSDKPDPRLSINKSTDKPQPRGRKKPAKPKKLPEPAELKKPANPLIEATDEAGVIRGVVRWKGTLPPAPKAGVVRVNGRDVGVEPANPVQVEKETGGMANVLVWLDKAPADDAAPSPEVVRLTQSRGAFVPHVQIVPVGSRLQMRTADDEADFQGTGPTRFSRSLRRGESAEVKLTEPGLIVVKSEDRPWMAPASIRVMAHSVHAVTGRDGSFKLPKLKAGEYQVTLWHEGWIDEKRPAGKPVQVRATVKVSDEKGARIQWTLP